MILFEHAQKCISTHVHPSHSFYDWKHPGRRSRRRDEFQKTPDSGPACEEDCPVCQSVRRRSSVTSHPVIRCREEGGRKHSRHDGMPLPPPSLSPFQSLSLPLLPFPIFDADVSPLTRCLSPSRSLSRLSPQSPSLVPTSLLRLVVCLPRDLSRRLSSQSPSPVSTSLLRLAVCLPRDLSPISPPSPHLRCRRLSSDLLFVSLAISLPSLIQVPISGDDVSSLTRCLSPGADECAVPILPVVNKCQLSILPPMKEIKSPSTDATTMFIAVPCPVSSSTRLYFLAPTISITGAGESILPCRKLPPVRASACHLRRRHKPPSLP